MRRSAPKVVIVDRHAWYLPVIEQEELARAGAEVTVGWAATQACPPAASAGLPDSEDERLVRSTSTSAFVPPNVTTEDEVIRMAQGADAILVVRARISARVMDALPTLRVVGRYGIGIDNIDADAARERGVAVVNAPGFCAREVADHAMMLLLALSRRLRFLDQAMRGGHWARDVASPMPALHAQTLGLIGFGEIGREMTRRAQTFGLTVVAHDPYIDASRARAMGVEPLDLDAVLTRADYLSLHAPLVAQTRHMIGAEQLRRMKRTAFLINTSRGPLVDQAALEHALDQGLIAGAGLDVFEAEPVPAGTSLLQRENVLLTPHVGGLSDEGEQLQRRIVARAAAEALQTTPPRMLAAR